MNRADPTLLEYMQFHIDNVDVSKGPTYEKVKKFGQILIDNCESSSSARTQVALGHQRWRCLGLEE
jgi:hypothetical protein